MRNYFLVSLLSLTISSLPTLQPGNVALAPGSTQETKDPAALGVFGVGLAGDHKRELEARKPAESSYLPTEEKPGDDGEEQKRGLPDRHLPPGSYLDPTITHDFNSDWIKRKHNARSPPSSSYLPLEDDQSGGDDVAHPHAE